jgi:hypothetical protein
VFAFALIGAITSCDDDGISGIEEGFDETATWRADMNGANERPNPVTTPAVGRAWFTDNGTTITYYMEYSGLLANAVNAHIHRIPVAPAVEPGPVMVQLAFVAGQRSGVVSGTIDMQVADISVEGGTQTPAELRALLDNGGAYVNVHSSSGTTPNTGFPGGEIRGTIQRQ